MIENQSIIKKERINYQPRHDMLSELPLSIIHIILALVPFRDAVRTCVLSRQWRYTWTSLPHLVFEHRCASYDPTVISKYEESMENFITRALFHHKGPIHKFKISFRFESCNPDINEWILCLSRNDVRELILDMGNTTFSCDQVTGSSIYSCEKLTNLKLTIWELDPLPSTFKGFLFLRCLFLEEVHMSYNVIESLVANCPVLERFNLLNSGDELRFSSPSLKYLCVSGLYNEPCVSAPLLAELSIEFLCNYFSTYHQEQESSVCNYTDFMAGFTNLEKLSGRGYVTEYLSMDIEFCHHTLVFHHLKDIALEEVDFEDMNKVSVVARFIVGAPNLQRLVIHGQADKYAKRDDESEAPHLSFGEFGCAPNFTLEKLGVVTMFGVRCLPVEVELNNFLLESSPVLKRMAVYMSRRVRGLPHEMELIKFLYESSHVLETMNVYMSKFLTKEEKQNITAELLGFSRASPNAELSFRHVP